MREVLTITAILISTSSLALGQGLKSPYAGQEKREIKSLSRGKIQVEMKKILALEQIDKYDELRGYKSSGGKDSHHRHQHEHH